MPRFTSCNAKTVHSNVNGLATCGPEVFFLALDPKTKPRGSLKHYFNSTAQKVNSRREAGLDALVDYLSEDQAPIVLADKGAG